MTRLDQPGVVVTVLPTDPLRPALSFADAALAANILPERTSGYTANVVNPIGEVTSTSEALVRYSTNANGTWRAFAAIKRDGGTQIGFDAHSARHERQAPDGTPRPPVYYLFVLVHAARIAIDAQAKLAEWMPRAGFEPDEFAPYELVVTIPGAGGGILGGFPPGWREPSRSFDDDLCRCFEQDPVLRLEVENWPLDQGTRQHLLEAVADRIGDAFGDRRQCHLAREGPAAGTTPVDYA